MAIQLKVALPDRVAWMQIDRRIEEAPRIFDTGSRQLTFCEILDPKFPGDNCVGLAVKNRKDADDVGYGFRLAITRALSDWRWPVAPDVDALAEERAWLKAQAEDRVCALPINEAILGELAALRTAPPPDPALKEQQDSGAITAAEAFGAKFYAQPAPPPPRSARASDEKRGPVTCAFDSSIRVEPPRRYGKAERAAFWQAFLAWEKDAHWRRKRDLVAKAKAAVRELDERTLKPDDFRRAVEDFMAQPPTSTPRLGCRICGKPVDALLSQGANLCTICALDVRVEAQDSPEWALSAVLGKLERAAWWPVERLRAWLIGRVVDRRIAAARERKEAAGA